MAAMASAVLALLLAAPPPGPPLRDLLAAAQAAFEASDRAAARRELTRAASLYPKSAVVQNFLGILDAEDGDRAGAEARFREAAARDPRYTDAYLNLGRLLQEAAPTDPSAPKRALAAYDAILAYDPAHAEANFQAATLRSASADFQGAWGHLERMPKEAQDRPAARQLRVSVLLELARLASGWKDWKGALGYLAHARALEPGNPRIHFLFGIVCVQLDLGVEAYNSLAEAVRLAPDDAHANYALGAVALHRREPAEAIPYFRKYANLVPGEPRGALALGVAHFGAGDFAAARAELAKAAAQAPTAAAANYFLARMAREENDLAEALRLVEKSVEAFPDYADAHAERGLVLFRLRRLEEAEGALRRALALDADNYLANLHLQMLYERNRDPRAAEQAARVEALNRRRDEKADEFRRVIQVQPN
jgi:tetratricopeptide (TPR) repeat protein